MSWFDPTAPLNSPDVDLETQRVILENMLKQANAIRATTPRGSGPMSENMVSGHYIIPYGQMAQQLVDPIIARQKESEAFQKLADLGKSRKAKTEEIINALPKDKDGNLDTTNKGALLKWVMQASESDSPVMSHILPAVVRGIFPSTNPLDTLSVALAKQNDQQEATKELEGVKHSNKIDELKKKAELGIGGPRTVDPTVQAIRQQQLSKLQAEAAQKAEGKALSEGDKTKLLTGSEGLADALRLKGDFKDEFAGGITKAGERLLGDTLGASSSILDKQAYPMSQWWSNYELFKNIPERFAKFGASLTENEKKNWASATINPKMDPATIREKMDTQIGILKNHMTAFRTMLKDQGFNTRAINDVFAQYGLIQKGRKLDPSNTEHGIDSNSLQPGDSVGDSPEIWDGSRFVQPRDYMPELNVGPKQSKEDMLKELRQKHGL